MTRNMRREYSSHNYTLALSSLEQEPYFKKENNKLLYLLEKATILNALHRRNESRSLFIEADKLADYLFTTSISKEPLSYLYNESSRDYAGESYEKVAIHIMLALSFLEDNNLQSSLVEARKLNNKLYEVSSSASESSSYKEDAFARFLSGLIYEAKKDYDNAIIDYKKALSLYESNYFNVPVPYSLLQSLYIAYTKRSRHQDIKFLLKKYPELSNTKVPNFEGTLITIRKSGLIAYKVSQEFHIPIDKQVVTVTFPTIRPNYSNRGGYPQKVYIGDKSSVKEDLVQNMDNIAYHVLEEKRLALTTKAAARALLKAKINHELQKEDSALGTLGAVGFQIYSIASERSDTRSWNLCPSGFYISRTNLSAGDYAVVFNNEKMNINIKPNQTVFLIR